MVSKHEIMMDFLDREELNNNFPDSVGNLYSLPGTKFELFSNLKQKIGKVPGN